MRESFFAGRRADFYRPLTGFDRAVIEDVLVRVYEAFFGQRFSFTYSMDRDQLKAIVLDSLQRIPLLTKEGEEKESREFSEKDDSTKANTLIKKLLDHDHLEEFVDTESMIKRYRFTFHGKRQAELFAELGKPELRMPERNTRNCRVSIMAYVRTGDPYDLFTAAKFARDIVHDFAEAETAIRDEQRRVIAGATQEFALTGYMNYVEKKFMTDHAIRLSADNVNRFNREIRKEIKKLLDLPDVTLYNYEKAAREKRPDFDVGSGSLVRSILDEIQRHLSDAMKKRMPALLRAASEFGSRASFIAIQASIVNTVSGMNQVSNLADALKEIGPQGQDPWLEEICWTLAPVSLGIVDESMLRLRKGRDQYEIQTVDEVIEPTREERLRVYIERALNVELGISLDDMREGVLTQLDQSDIGEMRLSGLPVKSYEDVVFLTHAVEAGCAPQEKENRAARLECDELGERVRRGPVEFEDMIIRRRRGRHG